MSINLDDRAVAMWFMVLEPGVVDWMAFVGAEGDHFRMVMRFRYYDPKDPYADALAKNNNDEKSWYESITKPGVTREVVIEKVREIVTELEKQSGARCDEIIRGEKETIDDFIDRMAGYEWAHVRVEKPKKGKR